MISVIAHNHVREGCSDEFLAVMKELVEQTVTLDAGCISYAAFRDLEDPLSVMVFEEWENQQAIDNHLSSDHFLDTVTKIIPFCAKATDVRHFKKLF